MSAASSAHDGGPLVRRSAASTVASLFDARGRIRPGTIAIEDGARRFTYGELDERTRRFAGLLARGGVRLGSRVAIFAENRLEYLELFIAAARIGAIVACQNWRLASPELVHCLDLVAPQCILVSPRYEQALKALGRDGPPSRSSSASPTRRCWRPRSRSPTTRRSIPKKRCSFSLPAAPPACPRGAVISHRAEVARNMAPRAEFGLAPDDTFVAWSPLYHMGAAEFSLGTLMSGGKVIVVDGFDQARLCGIVAADRLGWLLLMPGMVGSFAAELKRRAVKPKGVKVCGVMADLVPPSEIAQVTRQLGAPYANTFGATETGYPPCSSNLIPVGVAPTRLSKRQSPFCEVRLVDENDRAVADGTPGELCMRGPTLFSGYRRAPEVNEKDFRGGWFHMGDVFVRNPDGTLDFVDRVKYLIKSGGENIYPAEIERVMLQDPRVADVAVVRRPDSKWGEVPVAFVARRDGTLTKDVLAELCRAELAGYKQPKEIRFILFEDFPRSASGKIQRHELEKHL